MNAAAITLPLPADVDLSEMPHLPLFDTRLMKSRSWLRAKSWRGDGPGLGFILINLWSAAFREAPSGSLEDADEVLAEAARCDIAHWRACKDAALSGWKLIDGRWHHPVLSEICFGLWIARLDARHENAVRSWKMACKRKSDAGVEPPDPPGEKRDWLTRVYPLTAAYLAARSGHSDTSTSRCDSHNGESDCNIDPKRSEGKGLIPPVVPPDGTKGLGMDDAAKAGKAGKRWFAEESGRLHRMFGRDAVMLSAVACGMNGKRGSQRFAMVERFKGCLLAGDAILFPTKRRADAFVAERGDLMREHLPKYTVRHATVDELRAFKSEEKRA